MAEKLSNPGHALVIFFRDHGAGGGFRVQTHGAELDHVEFFKAKTIARTRVGTQQAPGAALSEQHRPGRLRIDHCGDYRV
jgi:hypothetical protein